MSDRLSFEPIGGAKLAWVPYLSYPIFQLLERLVREALVTKEIGPSIASVVMAVACAEAYANEVAHMTLSTDVASCRQYRRLSTDVVKKYRYLATEKERAFEEQADPFHSVKLVVGLRGLVVHYQIGEEPIELQQTKLEKGLASKFLPGAGDVSTVRILTGACANWALDTSFAMIRHLYDIGYEPPNVAWFEAFRPGWTERASKITSTGAYRLRDM
ncbi:MAG: hypothetical protein Q7T33_02240 [Dehalococcoidia bacterium]|nr:hypothetical protein [Dehalococcoidia bacterium]